MTARSPATAPGYHAGRTPANKGNEYPPEILTMDELKRLLAQPSRHAPTGIRNRALIALMARSALRCAEALALEKRDIDMDARVVRVRHGKNDKRRTVSMDDQAFAFLERWLDWRTRLKIPGRIVFCTLDGRPLHSSYVRTLLPRLAKKAGITKRVHAHGLRHTFAVYLANRSTPPHEIQAWLGHSSLHTTSIYLNHITPTDLVTRARSFEDWWDGDI
jgi:site-specific recombinase XerD